MQGSHSAPSLKFANNIYKIGKASQDTSSPRMQLDGEKCKFTSSCDEALGIQLDQDQGQKTPTAF